MRKYVKYFFKRILIRRKIKRCEQKYMSFSWAYAIDKNESKFVLSALKYYPLHIKRLTRLLSIYTVNPLRIDFTNRHYTINRKSK